jgi:hypothetical protein
MPPAQGGGAAPSPGCAAPGPGCAAPGPASGAAPGPGGAAPGPDTATDTRAATATASSNSFSSRTKQPLPQLPTTSTSGTWSEKHCCSDSCSNTAAAAAAKPFCWRQRQQNVVHGTHADRAAGAASSKVLAPKAAAHLLHDLGTCRAQSSRLHTRPSSPSAVHSSRSRRSLSTAVGRLHRMHVHWQSEAGATLQRLPAHAAGLHTMRGLATVCSCSARRVVVLRRWCKLLPGGRPTLEAPYLHISPLEAVLKKAGELHCEKMTAAQRTRPRRIPAAERCPQRRSGQNRARRAPLHAASRSRINGQARQRDTATGGLVAAQKATRSLWCHQIMSTT